MGTFNKGFVPSVRPITRYWKIRGLVFHNGGFRHDRPRDGEAWQFAIDEADVEVQASQRTTDQVNARLEKKARRKARANSGTVFDQVVATLKRASGKITS